MGVLHGISEHHAEVRRDQQASRIHRSLPSCRLWDGYHVLPPGFFYFNVAWFWFFYFFIFLNQAQVSVLVGQALDSQSFLNEPLV